jgi:hypothetical protein
MQALVNRPVVPLRASDALDLACEYRANPGGRHSADLHALLCRMRTIHFGGRVLVLSSNCGRRYDLVLVHGDRRVTRLDDGAFATPPEAEWRLFELRWEHLFGTKLQLRP